MENKENLNQVVQTIFADLIDEPSLAMRTDIDRDELWNLAEDIKVNGLINPITVRPVATFRGERKSLSQIDRGVTIAESDIRYEIVAGHRRFLACCMAGVLRISCVVRDVSDDVLLGIMASENLVRENVDPVDEARFIKRMMNEKGMNPAQVAATIRRSRQYVDDRLVVAAMPEYMQDFLKSGELKLGVAITLMDIEPEEKRRLWVGLAVQDNISVRTAEYWAYQHKLGTLPAVAVESTEEFQAPGQEPRTPMFLCQLDGREHPTTEMRSLIYSVQHAETLKALSAGIQDELAANAFPANENADAGAVAPASPSV